MELNYLAPVISDWCPVCMTYGKHDNGSQRMPRPMDPPNLADGPALTESSLQVDVRSVTRCQNCSWPQIYA